MARSPRRPPVLLLHLAWLCALGCTCVSTFNLDQDKVIKKVGDKNSFFGFSLAMHRQLQPAEKRMLLVGAPRAKALDKQKANITGGLYSCEVTTQTNDCKRVIFDNDVDSTKENKENQWMGVTVRSQGPGGKILACAHRYQKWQFVSQPQETRDIIGRCYVLSQDLTINTASAEDGGSWKFCDGRVRGHERFGSCQQGLSATFTKNYHYLVFGAPGGYNWKGIVRVEQKNTTLEDQGIFDDGPYEVGDESALDATLVPAPPNSYLGFSLDSGYKITKKGQLTIVAGAPRANHSGAVVLLKIDPEFKSRLIDEYTFEGQGLASSFGYDVTVADLNKDGWEDIVVGAPQYFLKDGEVGGAVYVYINREGKWNTVKPIQLNGNKDSMFGLAVENIGDINQDSYEDIAVGAPYDSNGEGKVYIYHGSASGITTKPVQILQANDANVKLFGYSLAGNMDLDKNSYPDVAVGSLMEMNACFSFSANPPSYNPRLTVDPEQSKRNMPPRATFLTKSPTDTNKLSGTVELLGQNNRQCIIQKLQLKDGKELKDKLRPIGVEVSVSIQDLKRRRRDSMLPQLVPVLDANNDKTKTQVGFSKEGCGADNICQSNLEMKYKFFYKDPKQDIFHPFQQKNGVPVMSLNDQKDIALEINVTNKNGDDAYEARVQAVFPSYLSYSAYRNQQVNCISNQNGSSAYCELGNPFKGGSEVTFYIILSTASMSLDIAEIEVDLNLETTSEQKNLNVVKAKAQVLTELLLSVSGVAKPSQVEFGGEIKGESAIINLGRPLKFFDTAFLNIQWPKETDNGKWILYLLSTTTEGRKKIPCSPQAEINPNKVSSGAETLCLFFPQMCGNGTKCVEIRCPLEGLESNAIVLQSRLWNSTFLEEYPSLNYLDIIVKASLHLDNTAHNIFMKNAETQVRVTVFPEKSVAKYSGMPWWIILVAILAGLLLLALLGFLLWKCGFFKRYKYDDKIPKYYAVRIKKQEQQDEKASYETPEKKLWMTRRITLKEVGESRGKRAQCLCGASPRLASPRPPAEGATVPQP
ncbi:integrin alpha-6-like [Scleropages formosus]|uniref:Integrin alpha-6-like n=1 Tax=Scleropages formosus TaxID=113540 RepID=A0A0P7V496_SCLFO|nr:integrin alpha-6-like [Scleropages formosus]